MTEKRFTLNYEINNYEDFMIKDNEKGKVLYDDDIEKVLNEQDQQIKEYKMVVASMMNPVKQVCKYYESGFKIDPNTKGIRTVEKCLKEQDIRHCDSCKYFIPNMLKL